MFLAAGPIAPWTMGEDNQAAIWVAIIAVIGLIVQWALNLYERRANARDHKKEMDALRKDTQSKQITALQTTNKNQEAEIHELQHRLDVFEDIAPAVRLLLFEKLHHLHDEMIDQHGVMADDDKKVAERIYTSYKALGGNGLGLSWYHDIMSAHSRPDDKKEGS